MIEHSRLPLSSPEPGDLYQLQQRMNRQRQRYKRPSQSLLAQQMHETSLAPRLSLFRVSPARFLLHTVVALVLPVAVLLSQFSTISMPTSVAQPALPPASNDIVAPVAPINLDAQPLEGDAPLEDNGDIPVPLSLLPAHRSTGPSSGRCHNCGRAHQSAQWPGHSVRCGWPYFGRRTSAGDWPLPRWQLVPGA